MEREIELHVRMWKYEARANSYLLVEPADLLSAAVSQNLAQARLDGPKIPEWVRLFAKSACASDRGIGSDGILIGPLQSSDNVKSLWIVNSDGSLAERSGNGLTIFATHLISQGSPATFGQSVRMRVYHEKPNAPPSDAVAEISDENGELIIDMGSPSFALSSVQADPSVLRLIKANEKASVYTVPELAAINPRWIESVFVSMGNPHCVTFVRSEDDLPGFQKLLELKTQLGRIANVPGAGGTGVPCAGGTNLQWVLIPPHRFAPKLQARVFERSEGPTKSSGSSACAIASTAWARGFVREEVSVRMEGGDIRVRLEPEGNSIEKIRLWGRARRIASITDASIIIRQNIQT